MAGDWKFRATEGTPAGRYYSGIWDGDGWQINKRLEDGRFDLIDAVMPWWVPASGVVKTFDTLEGAQAEADRRGRPDWSGAEEFAPEGGRDGR